MKGAPGSAVPSESLQKGAVADQASGFVAQTDLRAECAYHEQKLCFKCCKRAQPSIKIHSTAIGKQQECNILWCR